MYSCHGLFRNWCIVHLFRLGIFSTGIYCWTFFQIFCQLEKLKTHDLLTCITSNVQSPSKVGILIGECVIMTVNILAIFCNLWYSELYCSSIVINNDGCGLIVTKSGNCDYRQRTRITSSCTASINTPIQHYSFIKFPLYFCYNCM